jgi:TIR domain
VSFVHKDEKVASAVQGLLQTELSLSDGVFLSSDKSPIHAGDLWLEKIKEALSAAETVIVMLSRRSVARPWVNFEAGAAWLAGKKGKGLGVTSQQPTIILMAGRRLRKLSGRCCRNSMVIAGNREESGKKTIGPRVAEIIGAIATVWKEPWEVISAQRANGALGLAYYLGQRHAGITLRELGR